MPTRRTFPVLSGIGGYRTVAIHWKDFPHKEILSDIHSRLNQNSVERSADDSLQHILRRRLRFLVPAEHAQFIQLESRRIFERLRCTRDAYRAFTDAHGCSPASEAYWVILRFAVLPTAIATLKQSVADYVGLTRVAGADLSLVFGIPTEACHLPRLDRKPGRFDLDDRTPATYTEIQGLAALVNEDTLLWLEDHRVGHPYGDGPFAPDDTFSTTNSWVLCGMPGQVTLTDWMPDRQKLWRARAPWTEGLMTLFTCVRDELMSQCFALSPDGEVQERRRNRQPSEFESVTVPEPVNEFVKDRSGWTITFMGRTTKLSAKIIGLDYISVILRSDGRPISALELQSAAGGNVSNSQYVENAVESLREDDENDLGEGDVHSALHHQDYTRDPILDDIGRGKLKVRLLDLEEQATAAIEGGNVKKAEQLQNEYDQIERELERSRNLHRRPRVFSSENEKARTSITNALSRAYDKIRQLSPEAADHLKSGIATGSEFWYREHSMKWKF
jgi:hypothetical protein